jgi:4-hydroxybenzoate polyprenyltransferase
MAKLPDKIRGMISELENSPAPFIYFVLTFFFAVTLRNFLEKLSGRCPYALAWHIYHCYLFYICIALSLIILFYAATREKIENISRVVLPSFLVLILPPLIDLIASTGRGYSMTYLFPGPGENIWWKFLTFFGNFNGRWGVTPGIRIETALIIAASFIYFSIKGLSLARRLFFSFLTYCVIFAYGAMPFIIGLFIKIFKLEPDWQSFPLTDFYLLLILILAAAVFYWYNPEYFRKIAGDIRFPRLLHYELMFILGTVLAGIFSSQPVTLTQNNFFPWIFIMFSIVFAWLFSLTANNLADLDTDRIVNKARPLAREAIPLADYKILSWIFFLLAITYSFMAGPIILFFILFFIGNYFLYSMPPLRLKRVTFFSKFFISLNSMAMIMLGYFFLVGHFKILAAMRSPARLIVLFWVLFTAPVNFIDLKDYAGDKQAGIKTLPVIFGLAGSKKIIGVFFLIAYLSVYFMFRNVYLLAPLAGLGILQFFLINRKNYDERPVFIVYLFSIVALITYLIIFVKPAYLR